MKIAVNVLESMLIKVGWKPDFIEKNTFPRCARSLKNVARWKGQDFARHQEPCEEVLVRFSDVLCRKEGGLQEFFRTVRVCGACREEGLTTSSAGLVLTMS